MKWAQSLRVCCVLTFPHFLPFNQSSTKTRAETQCACREQLPSLYLRVCSQSSRSPPGEAGLILPCPLQLLKPCRPLPSWRCPGIPMPAPACWKGCWRKAQWLSPGIEPLLSFLGGSGGRRRSMEQSHLPTTAFGVGNRYPPWTKLYTWKCISTSCNFHSICSAAPAPWLSRWAPSLLPALLPSHPLHPAFQAWLSCTRLSLLGPWVSLQLCPERPPSHFELLLEKRGFKCIWTSFFSPPLSFLCVSHLESRIN